MSVVVIVFGSMVYRDIYWLPARHLNYPSWSYGLAIVSTFFFIFGSIAQAKYVQIARREHIQPPKAYEVPMVTDIDIKASSRPLMNTSMIIPPKAVTSSGGSVTPPLVVWPWPWLRTWGYLWPPTHTVRVLANHLLKLLIGLHAWWMLYAICTFRLARIHTCTCVIGHMYIPTSQNTYLYMRYRPTVIYSLSIILTDIQYMNI